MASRAGARDISRRAVLRASQPRTDTRRSGGGKFGYEIVNVRPWAHAGGSFATALWERLERPAAVEHIRAKAGIDIGGTLIGMHLKEVAVPVRLSISRIGEAPIICARTRPRFIGGERARYQDELR